MHLIQRERKRVIEFPSLMFVQKIPYQSVRRRRIRHWALLLMRALAIALIVAAFARPFLPASAAASLAATGGSREVVILLDQSASMGYGDRWQRARDEAGKVIDSMSPADKATLVLFSRNAEENMRATSDRGRLQAALRSASLTAGGTRFGPALKLAESILARSTLQRKEAVLISDFQKTGWTGSEDVHFSEGTTLTPVSVATETVANICRAIGELRALVLLEPGAHHGHRRRREPQRGGGQRSRFARDRRARDRDAPGERRGECIGVDFLLAVHAERSVGARRREGRHRPDAGRQHVRFRR